MLKHLLPYDTPAHLSALMHFSRKPLLLENLERKRQPVCDYKPEGLWVSDEQSDMSWSSWCAEENFGLGKCINKITLYPEARILHIDTIERLLAFTEKYCTSFPWGSPNDRRAINWYEVSLQFEGILITPYQWGGRHQLVWYYGWDCASGCIWNPSVIKRIDII